MDGLKVNENEYLPLRDVVFNTLRRAILRGELVPGQRLMEIQLAEKMGVSRTPVREAIRKLELEGLVVMIPRKGAEVAHISGKNLRDVLEVRRALEELAGELACERMTEEEFRLLEQANHKFTGVVGSDDITVIAQADEAFHGLIYQATENERLIQMVNHLREQMYRYRIEHIKDRSQRKVLVQEHQEIMRALAARDVEATRRAIRNHINKQEVAVSKNIREQEK
ncbi:GntR family transcriptional regulator [Fusibacillus kribbianus]|uniref:GntR family transcriptional regulator n=1 Tax=Fusibacillus kribbianus TaxID=3044208 RepID=A0AAP4EXH7_9FIRM|nr:GntR family transcriptional regulator [Ruminococcus sp. YH-rum2234]MDI9242559.1 GntR family transcriptional regulator [Ruminococcus sp. YH-rum2234]